MQKINESIHEMGLRPAPEPLERPIRIRPRELTKVPGESKAERRMRRRNAAKVR